MFAENTPSQRSESQSKQGSFALRKAVLNFSRSLYEWNGMKGIFVSNLGAN